MTEGGVAGEERREATAEENARLGVDIELGLVSKPFLYDIELLS